MRPPGNALAAVMLVALAAATGSAAPASAVSPLTAAPITAVILADESGSLTAAGVASERDAASAIVTSDLSPNSRFTIVGFGSDNGQPGQDAVHDYCGFIAVTGPRAREALGRCAQQIHARTVAEGNDTDHATALQHAIDELKAAHTAPGSGVIFLLTDGVLDVHNSPAFGATPERRNAEAERRIVQQFLPAARAAGIQIWPLGFGPAVSRPALEAFAAGGAGANKLCSGVNGTQPHAIVVGSTGDVIHSLVLALERARCGDVGPAVSAMIPTGGSATLSVEIPPIATDGAITVTKGEPSFQVSFVDPRGRVVPDSGSFDGQQFQLSGESGRVEALRIGDPLAGTWKVKISDPQHVANRSPVSAFAVWQGSLQASLLIDPALPRPGSVVHLELRVLSRNGIVSERALKSAGARASGSVTDRVGTRPISLADDGKGVFRGSFILPSNEKGQVEVKARVSGSGLAADERVLSFSVQLANFISASFNLNVPATVSPGSTLQGTVSVLNQGPQRTVVLKLTGLNQKTLLVVSAPTAIQTIPNGKSQVPFTLTVPNQSPQGQLDGQLQLVSDGQVIGQTYLATIVAKPKSFLGRNGWVLPLAIVLVVFAALAVLAALLLRRKRLQAETSVRELSAVLTDRQGNELSDVDVSHGGQESANEFGFTIVRSDDGSPIRLDPPGSEAHGDPVVVRRRRDRLQLTIDGVQKESRLGEPIEVGEGRMLTVNRTSWAPLPDESGESVIVSGIRPASDDDSSPASSLDKYRT